MGRPTKGWLALDQAASSFNSPSLAATMSGVQELLWQVSTDGIDTRTVRRRYIIGQSTPYYAEIIAFRA